MKRPISRRFGERGDSRAGCLLWSLLLGVLILIAVKTVPVQLSVMKLKDRMEEAAQTRGRNSARNIKKFIIDRAEELNLPVGPKNVEVKKNPNTIHMKVNFTVPLDFYVYTRNWDIEIDMLRDIYLF